jgi:CDP-4-dehydro-6-deoxyglucose reductase
MPQITNLSSQNTFNADNKTSILDSALKAGLNFPYGCTNGFCGKCKVEIISGEVEYPEGLPKGISQSEAENYALICKCVAKSDIEIKVDEITPEIRVKELSAEVVELNKLNHDVLKIVLKTPEKLAFLAGQYVEIGYGDFAPRAFSIANKSGTDLLEFHIRIIKGGEFTNFLATNLQVGDIVKINGPKGDFYLRDDNKDILLVAGGTGLAPVKAIIEELQARNDKRNITFYWGVRDEVDLYLDFATVLKDTQVKFTPVLSAGNNEKYRSGFVHQAILEDIDDFTNYAVYACGPPAMVAAVANTFIEYKMDKDSFFNDSFEFNTK